MKTTKLPIDDFLDKWESLVPMRIRRSVTRSGVGDEKDGKGEKDEKDEKADKDKKTEDGRGKEGEGKDEKENKEGEPDAAADRDSDADSDEDSEDLDDADAMEPDTLNNADTLMNADILDLRDLNVTHIRPPVFVIEDHCYLIDETLLPMDPDKRLRDLFVKFSPRFPGDILENLVGKLLSPDVKSSAYLLKHARAVFVEVAKKSAPEAGSTGDDVEEVRMYVPKFRIE